MVALRGIVYPGAVLACYAAIWRLVEVVPMSGPTDFQRLPDGRLCCLRPGMFDRLQDVGEPVIVLTERWYEAYEQWKAGVAAGSC